MRGDSVEWEHFHGEVTIHTAAETIVVTMPSESGPHQRTTLMELGEQGWALITSGTWDVSPYLIHFPAVFRRPAWTESLSDDEED